MSQDTALVLEGGGFRSMFTSGVLDVFMERGLYGFGSVWGVSAGALVGASFVSRQIGRSCRINLAYRDDRRYMSAYQLATTGNIMSTTFLYQDVQNELDPFDYVTFNSSATTLYAVASDVVFGQPAYLKVDSLPEKTDYLRVSASLPMVSQIVEVQGRRYLDGGTCDSVPVEQALRQEGTTRAVVVLTQDRAYAKKPVSTPGALRTLYGDYPYYLEALLTRPERYNAQRQRIWELERQGSIVVIAPERPVEVGNMEHDGAKLLDLYQQGRDVASKVLADVAAFVGR